MRGRRLLTFSHRSIPRSLMTTRSSKTYELNSFMIAPVFIRVFVMRYTPMIIASRDVGQTLTNVLHLIIPNDIAMAPSSCSGGTCWYTPYSRGQPKPTKNNQSYAGPRKSSELIAIHERKMSTKVQLDSTSRWPRNCHLRKCT